MVKASDRVGNLWVIDSGLKVGEKVIVEGIQKVKPGVKVTATPEQIEKTASPTPNAAPADSGPKDAKGK
jgi:membrane fusion protein (multidrug efflux system)